MSGLTRGEGWRLDIDYPYSETRRVNPDYHAAPFPAEVTRRYEQLKRDVPTLSNEEIYVGMNHMLDEAREISPQIPVQLTAEAYFAGRYPALEAIFAVIHARG